MHSVWEQTSQRRFWLKGLLLTSVHTQPACILAMLLRICIADSQPPLWLEGLLLISQHT